MFKKPAISIIVPVYNVESYIDKCIDSILSQTFKDFELLLINDGSTDNSGRICDKYAFNDERIKVIHKLNGGQSTARNKGIDIARGEYLGFVDADDYIAKAMFETLHTLATKYDAHISECGFISVFINNEAICEFGNGIEFGEGDYLVEKFLSSDIFYGVVTKLFKKSLFDAIRFPEGRIFEDTWLTLNFCLQPLRYVRTQPPLYYYNQTELSTLRSEVTPRKAREYIYILESQIELIQNKVTDSLLKERLRKKIMEKSVLWYLDLALSDNKKLRQPYSKLYLKRMDFSLGECLLSGKISLKNKLSYLLCRMGLSAIVRLVKNLAS